MRDDDEQGLALTRLDGVHSADPDLWVPALVQRRLIEAVRIGLWTGGPVGPRGVGICMPREWIEAASFIVDEDGENADDAEEDADERPKRPPLRLKPHRVSMIEAATLWPMTYLQGQDAARRILALFLACKAYRTPFQSAVRARKWSRATAYRRRDQALAIIAQGLNRDGIPVEI